METNVSPIQFSTIYKKLARAHQSNLKNPVKIDPEKFKSMDHDALKIGNKIKL